MFPQNHDIVKMATGSFLWCSEPSREAVTERLRVAKRPGAAPPLREVRLGTRPRGQHPSMIGIPEALVKAKLATLWTETGVG